MTIGAPPRTDFELHASDRDVAFFAEHGYLAVDSVTTPDELEWLRQVYDDLVARPRSGFLDAVFDLAAPYGTLEEPTLGQLLFPERYVPLIRETAMWKNARRIAARLLGAPEHEVESWGHLMFKPPLRGTVTPWHQDEAYWDPDLSYHAVGAWMPLDDADVDNGCLWFLPGSHRGEVGVHRHGNDDPAVHVLELVEAPDTTTAVPVPLKAGGMSFHHPRPMHYAGPNRTQRRRRAWANEYQTAPIRRQVPADRPWVRAGREALKSRAARGR
jgi:hypothetical protein